MLFNCNCSNFTSLTRPQRCWSITPRIWCSLWRKLSGRRKQRPSRSAQTPGSPFVGCARPPGTSKKEKRRLKAGTLVTQQLKAKHTPGVEVAPRIFIVNNDVFPQRADCGSLWASLCGLGRVHLWAVDQVCRGSGCVLFRCSVSFICSWGFTLAGRRRQF